MRLATLALLIILPAAEYAAARPQGNSLESRFVTCAAYLQSCTSPRTCCDNTMQCGDYLVSSGDQNHQGVAVRYRVPVHLFCFLLTGILV